MGIFKKFLFIVYVLVCGELTIRVIASVSIMPVIELLVYARDLTQPSSVPGLSREHVPNATAVLMGKEIRLNARGHRSQDLSNPKPENEHRIYFMGTSITLGWGVGQEETFSAIVERLLTDKRTPGTGLRYVSVNAGVANFNTINEVVLFRKDVDAVQPDTVILQYYLRDAEFNAETRDSELLTYSYLAAFLYQRLRSLWSSHKQSLEDHYRSLHRDGRPEWEQVKQAIRELKTLTDARGLPLAVLLIPDLRDPSADSPMVSIYEDVTKFFTVTGVDVIDPHAAVRAHLGGDFRAGWAHPADPHPNAEIHKILGEAIYNYLTRRTTYQ